MQGLIRKAVVLRKLQVGKTKLHEMIRDGSFPPPTKLPSVNGKPGRTSYWSAEAVDEWIARQLRATTFVALSNCPNDPFARNSWPVTVRDSVGRPHSEEGAT